MQIGKKKKVISLSLFLYVFSFSQRLTLGRYLILKEKKMWMEQKSWIGHPQHYSTFGVACAKQSDLASTVDILFSYT